MIEFFKLLAEAWRLGGVLADAIVEMQSRNRCHDPELRAQFKR